MKLSKIAFVGKGTPLILFFFLLLTHVHAFSDIPHFDSNKISKFVESTLNEPQGSNQTEFVSIRYQLRIIGFLSFVTLIPFAVMMTTSFTRISIVLHFLRQAIGSQQVPSNQIVIGLAIILTGFVMHPVIKQVEQAAITPYINNEFRNLPQVEQGNKNEELILMEKAWIPLRNFLLQHTREKDLVLFLEIAHIELPSERASNFNHPANEDFRTADLESVPWYCLIPAFVLSELRIAFMMGFLLFLPFLIIDMVVSAILMSMGMMMLPPMMVSTPFKLLLFILIDGWRLIIQQIVNSYYPI